MSLRYRIVSPVVPWMTTRYTFRPHPATSERSMLADRFQSVRRTCRIKSAGGREHWGYCDLIAANERDKNCGEHTLHSCLRRFSADSRRVATEASMKSKVTSSDMRFGSIKNTHDRSIWCSRQYSPRTCFLVRKDSLRSRRSKLRSTAFFAFLTANPTIHW